MEVGKGLGDEVVGDKEKRKMGSVRQIPLMLRLGYR